MIVTRFGDTYSTAYQISLLKNEQVWTTNRPTVGSQVSGSSGEFDHFVNAGNPIQPVDITIKFDLKGTSYANVDTQLLALLAEFAINDQYRLWVEDRSGNQYYGDCKITAVTKTERYGTGYMSVPSSVTFRNSSGLWYDADPQIETLPASGEHYFFVTASQLGNYPSTLLFFVSCNTGEQRVLLARLAIQNTIGVTESYVQWRDTYDGADVLEVDTEEYSIKDLTDGSDIYATVTGSTTYQNVPWQAIVGPSDVARYGLERFVAGSAITDATNATPIVITASVVHGLSNGDCVTVQSVTGNTAANGVWIAANVTTYTFELSGSVGNGAFVSGAGQWYTGGTISNISTGSTTPTITTTVNHGLTTGNQVSLINVETSGVTNFYSAIYNITVTGVNTFTVDTEGLAAVGGTYTSGAVWAFANYTYAATWKKTYVF